ncbi:MAG: response regulator transcription factor [Chloroflexota bacterium]|nr:response regulator transcription factor [Chloroflexota bacterium]
MKTILLVDDDKKIVRLVRDYLEAAGFQVLTAYDGTTALAIFRHERPDLIVLDLNLPGTDGLDVAGAIRKERNTPIIVLTARVEEADRIVGLELGADDYVTKPFSPRELVARVRAVLRRTGEGESEPASALIRVGKLVIDPERRLVTAGGQAVNLTTTEFDLLIVLTSTPGRVFSRMELLDRVQGYAYEGYERTVDVHIKNLRRKIEPDPRHPRYILTVYGVGYRFAEDADAE